MDFYYWIIIALLLVIIALLVCLVDNLGQMKKDIRVQNINQNGFFTKVEKHLR